MFEIERVPIKKVRIRDVYCIVYKIIKKASDTSAVVKRDSILAVYACIQGTQKMRTFGKA